MKKTTIGSDHYPVLTKIGSQVCYEKIKRIPRWKMENANWEHFQVLCAVRCLKLREVKEIDVNDFNGVLVDEIIMSAEESIPKVKGSKRSKNVPWWIAVKQSRQEIKLLSILKSAILKTQWKAIKARKRNFWREYCNSIGRTVKLSDVWGMIRRMGGIRRNYELPVLNSGDTVAINNLEKAELLAQTFRRVHSFENLTKEARAIRSNILREHPTVLVRKENSENPLDLPLTMFELRKAIISAKQTTPGKDLVCYKMLANMTDNTLRIILRLFNSIWDSGHLPSMWKHSIIVPVLKPGKEPSDPCSYRPIALTSQLGKVMERIVTERITYHMESKGLFSQSGFRKGRNTMDSVLCLESDIRKAQTNKEICNCSFL